MFGVFERPDTEALDDKTHHDIPARVLLRQDM
jgi:hypothetical protein